MKKLHFKSVFLLLFLAAGLLILHACSRNPVSGKKEFMLMSKNQELALGKQSDPAIVAQFGLYEDAKIQKFIQDKGTQMARISHRKELKYEFKVMDSPVINAFAVPGGYVYFTRGILAHFNNEAEFAGVLGHEIGHITARHSAKQYSKSMVAQVGFIAGMIASPAFRNYAGEAQQSLQLLFLKFGRDHETQSDKLGVEYSTAIGYDAKHMANFFKTLDRMRDGTQAGEIPTFMSTHPDPGDRFQNVGRLARAAQAKSSLTNFKVNRNEYLRMIDGLVYGEDPRQGYVEGNKFYHPELKFELMVPGGWQTDNSPAQFRMAPKDGKALMILTLAKENTLDAAKTAFLSENKMVQIESSSVKVNGLPAIALVAEPAPADAQQQQQQQQQQAEPIKLMTYFIQHQGKVYTYIAVTAKKDYAFYQPLFSSTLKQFANLTDQAKINVKPERVKVITVPSGNSLTNILTANKVPADRLKEISILNSMQLSDQVQAGTLIKVVEKR